MNEYKKQKDELDEIMHYIQMVPSIQNKFHENIKELCIAFVDEDSDNFDRNSILATLWDMLR